ncbi:MAG: folate family ECF transporter S component [Firmicutes bacterium]|nr:folate family ECF transporter S component [Bacillota bacterium]
MKKFDTKMLVTAAVLIALNVVLSRFLSINAWNIKIGFTFVSIFVAGYFYGPVFSVVVAVLGDVVGALLFPSGAFFPGFTLTALLTGLLFGVMLHKKQTPVRILFTVLANQLLLGLLLNTYWLSILYGTTFGAVVVTRIVQCLIMMPVEFVTITLLMKKLPVIKREVLK